MFLRPGYLYGFCHQNVGIYTLFTTNLQDAEEPLTDGIRSWGVIRSFRNRYVTRLGNPSEAHPKLAIVLMDEVLRPHTSRLGT